MSLARAQAQFDRMANDPMPPLPRVAPVRQLNEKLLSIVFKDGPLTDDEQRWLDAFEREGE